MAKKKRAVDLGATVSGRDKERNQKIGLIQGGQRQVGRRSTYQVRRTTERITISLKEEEKEAIEERAFRYKRHGTNKKLKPSQLGRLALLWAISASDEEIEAIEASAEDLEKRRGNRYGDDQEEKAA